MTIETLEDLAAAQALVEQLRKITLNGASFIRKGKRPLEAGSIAYSLHVTVQMGENQVVVDMGSEDLEFTHDPHLLELVVPKVLAHMLRMSVEIMGNTLLSATKEKEDR